MNSAEYGCKINIKLNKIILLHYIPFYNLLFLEKKFLTFLGFQTTYIFARKKQLAFLAGHSAIALTPPPHPTS